VADEAPRGQNSHDLQTFSAIVFLFGHVGLPAAPVTAATHTRALLKGSPSRTPRSQRHNAQTNAPAVQTPTRRAHTQTKLCNLAQHCHRWPLTLCPVLAHGGGHWVAPTTGLALPTTWTWYWIRAWPCLVTPTYTGRSTCPVGFRSSCDRHRGGNVGRKVPRQPQAPESGRMLM